MKRDSNPSKSSVFLNRRQMGRASVDRDSKYMYQMWGTTNLITDYWSLPHKTEDPEEIQSMIFLKIVTQDHVVELVGLMTMLSVGMNNRDFRA